MLIESLPLRGTFIRAVRSPLIRCKPREFRDRRNVTTAPLEVS